MQERLKLFKKAVEALDRVIERIANFAIYLGGIITLFMACATTYGVVARYIFHRPEHYTYEIGIFCLISSVALALPYIQRVGRNLRVDFLTSRFPPKTQVFMLNILVPLIALFYLVPLVWKSWESAFYSLSIGERTYSAWAPPVGPMKLFVPFGTGLVCLVLIAELVRGVLALRKK
jgi:TRAP-type C4-dicarboxylate transport system permease small subunit